MLERMTLIIDTIGGGSARFGVDALARRTGLPRSTVRRILTQLVRLGWVAEFPDGFGVGNRLGGVVADDRGHSDLRSAAAGHLHRLHVATGLVAHLVKRTTTQVFYLDKIGGPGADRVPSRVGGRAPLHATALGKSILAWWPAEQVEDLLGTGLARRTRRTIGDLGTMHEELARVRRRGGIAYDHGEHTEQVACVAACLRPAEGLPFAAVSLAGRAVEEVEPWAPLVLDAARRISADLSPALRGREPGAAEEEPESWSPQMLDRLMGRGHGDWI